MNPCASSSSSSFVVVSSTRHTSSPARANCAVTMRRATTSIARSVRQASRCGCSVREWHAGARGESMPTTMGRVTALHRALVTPDEVGAVRGGEDASVACVRFAVSGVRDDEEDEEDEEDEDVMVCPSDGGLGSKVLETWLMAVPKRKVTPSRRKRRNQFKRVPFIEEVVRCRVCGKANMPHVHCCDGLERERRPESTTGNSSEM